MSDPLVISYTFYLVDGRQKKFRISLRNDTLALIMDTPRTEPEWIRLGFHQCPNCTLDPAQHRLCPVGQALFEPVASFRDFISHEEADVLVETPLRNFTRRVPLHIGLSSMVGIYMVTSGCPVLEKLRPMVRYHLPFATEDETSYRAMSMYLMAQYLIAKDGGQPDWKLEGLRTVYDEVMMTNKHFIARLQNIPVKDASLNAVITLDCFAMSINFTLSGDMMDEIKQSFGVYLR